MEWKDEFQHGVLWQDFQHRQLLDNINMLVASVTSGNNDVNAFKKAAYFLAQYCTGHFKLEEEYMKKHGYSLAAAHIEQHNDFIRDFNKLFNEKNLNDAEKSTALLHKLLDWYAEHIVTSDKLLANFLLRHDIE
jgi:hemerythrin